MTSLRLSPRNTVAGVGFSPLPDVSGSLKAFRSVTAAATSG